MADRKIKTSGPPFSLFYYFLHPLTKYYRPDDVCIRFPFLLSLGSEVAHRLVQLIYPNLSQIPRCIRVQILLHTDKIPHIFDLFRIPAADKFRL